MAATSPNSIPSIATTASTSTSIYLLDKQVLVKLERYVLTRLHASVQTPPPRFDPDHEDQFCFLLHANELHIRLMKLVYSPLVRRSFPFLYSFYNPTQDPTAFVSTLATPATTPGSPAASAHSASDSGSSHFPEDTAGLLRNFYDILPKTDIQVVSLSHQLSQILSEQEQECPSDMSPILFETAKQGLPLALFWLALSYKHGWNFIEKDARKSFACLVMAAYLSTLALFKEFPSTDIPPPANLTESPTSGIRRCRSTSSETSNQVNGEGPKSNTLPISKRASQRYWRLVLSSRDRLTSIKSLASLYDPVDLAAFLSEIAQVFEFGLDAPLSEDGSLGGGIQDALYFYEIAAALGDSESAKKIGDLLYAPMPGCRRNKARAAAFYRFTERHGKKLINSTWIYKKKWGGPNP
jgi:hypothetical protein